MKCARTRYHDDDDDGDDDDLGDDNEDDLVLCHTLQIFFSKQYLGITYTARVPLDGLLKM